MVDKERWEMGDEEGFRHDVVRELEGISKELEDLGRIRKELGTLGLCAAILCFLFLVLITGLFFFGIFVLATLHQYFPLPQ
jgi:hypothetical protein